MSVCKYFLSGTCRFGNRCRFRHVYEDSGGQPGVPAFQRNQYHTPAPSNHLGYKDCLEKLTEYCYLIENHNLWPYTCFEFIPGHGSLPGWEDYSPEEVRWAAYRARMEGIFEAYIETVQELAKKCRGLRLTFLKPGKFALSVLEDYMKQKSNLHNPSQTVNVFDFMESRTSKMISNFSFANAGRNMGYQAKMEPHFSLASHPTFSMGNNSDPHRENFFGKVPQQNIFGAIPSQNFFNQPPSQQPSSFFSQTPERRTFGSVDNVEMETMCSSGLDQSHSQAFASFGLSSNKGTPSSGSAPVLESSLASDGIYSKVEDLSQEELEQFSAAKFTWGKIPLKPPPKELCNF